MPPRLPGGVRKGSLPAPRSDLHAAGFASVESFGKLQGLKLCCPTEVTHIVKLG